MPLHEHPIGRHKSVVEVVRDPATGVPTAPWHAVQCIPPLQPLRQRVHQHHPAPAKPLLGGGQPDALDFGDLSHGHPLRIMEDNGGSIDDGQPHQSVLQLLAGLGPLDHRGRVHGVGVVTPPCLHLAFDVFGGVLTVSTEPVDGEVVKDAVQPGGHRGISSKRVGSLEGAEHRLLHEVLGLLTVRRNCAGVSEQAGDLGSESATNVQDGHHGDASAIRCARPQGC